MMGSITCMHLEEFGFDGFIDLESKWWKNWPFDDFGFILFSPSPTVQDCSSAVESSHETFDRPV